LTSRHVCRVCANVYQSSRLVCAGEAVPVIDTVFLYYLPNA
jgi:hypothetical protein